MNTKNDTAKDEKLLFLDDVVSYWGKETTIDRFWRKVLVQMEIME